MSQPPFGLPLPGPGGRGDVPAGAPVLRGAGETAGLAGRSGQLGPRLPVGRALGRGGRPADHLRGPGGGAGGGAARGVVARPGDRTAGRHHRRRGVEPGPVDREHAAGMAQPVRPGRRTGRRGDGAGAHQRLVPAQGHPGAVRTAPRRHGSRPARCGRRSLPRPHAPDRGAAVRRPGRAGAGPTRRRGRLLDRGRSAVGAGGTRGPAARQHRGVRAGARPADRGDPALPRPA